MAFNISLLKETTESPKSIHSMVSAPKHFYLSEMELNEKLHEASVREAINKYRLIVESAAEDGTLPESFSSDKLSFNDLLVERLKCVLDFIDETERSITLQYTDTLAKYVEVAKLPVNVQPTNHGLCTFIYCPPSDNLIVGMQNLNSAMNSYFSDKSNSDWVSKYYKAIATTILSKSMGVVNKETVDKITDAHSFKRYISKNLIYSSVYDADYLGWLTGLRNDIDNFIKDNNASNYIHRLFTELRNVYNSLLSDAKTRNFVTHDEYTQFENWVGEVVNIIKTHAWLYYKWFDAKFEQMNQVVRFVNSHRVIAANESGFIHGEEFDSDTLFDNEDMRDFNRTEWLDLKLESEISQYDYEYNQYMNRVALREALILTDDNPVKLNRLIAMREAEGANFKKATDGIWAKISGIISKFISKLTNSLNLNNQYIKANLNVINRYPIDMTVKSKGDILAGMERLQAPAARVDYNYDNAEMRSALENKEAFFTRYVLPGIQHSSSIAKRNIRYGTEGDNMSISEYCKNYYGAPTKINDNMCEFKGEDFESRKAQIIDFLSSARGLIKSIKDRQSYVKSQLSKIPNMATDAPKPTETPNANTQNTNTGNNNNQNNNGATNEGYYSILFGTTWYNEADITPGESGGEEAKNDAENKENKTDNAAQKAFRNYLEVMRDVLLAQMTGAEYVQNELMQIIKAHVKQHMNKKKPQPQEGQQNNQNQNAQNNNQNNNQQQQQNNNQ